MSVPAFIQLLLVLQLLPSSVNPCDDGNYSHRSLVAVPPYQPGCDHLKLILSYNYIISIVTGDFEGFSYLRLLMAEHNQMENLDECAFVGAINLEKVVLSHNFISNLSNSFNRAPSLRDVHLDYNQIQLIDFNSFKGAPTIEHIILSFNQISEVSDDSFTHCPNLRTLNLAHNHIERIGGSLFQFNTKLTRIELQNNDLRFLPSELFSSLTSLTYVRLSDNPLHTLTFTLISPSIELHADNCGLTELPDIHFDGSGDGVIEIDLRGNMVQCDCYTVEMTVTSNRTIRCIDQHSGQYSPASCSFSEDVSTASSTFSTENKQTTDTAGIGVQNEHTRTHLRPVSVILPVIGCAIIFVIGLIVYCLRKRRTPRTGRPPQVV